MAEPLSRSKLREMAGRRQSMGPSTDLEEQLDSLLLEHGRQRQEADAPDRPEPPKSPIDVFRDRFSQQLIPLAEAVAERYREKGIGVTMDASDLLGGGRDVKIEITFGNNRTVLEGTVLAEAMAFNETRYISARGGMVMGGPMLRGRRLTNDGFVEFLYDRIIALVRAVGVHSQT